MGITRGRNLLDSTNPIYVYLKPYSFQVLRPKNLHTCCVHFFEKLGLGFEDLGPFLP